MPLLPTDLQDIRDLAWIGDAVLSLYARQWILKNTKPGAERGKLFTYFTNNQFLSGLGDPTRVEALIGQAYEKGGLEAGFEHIEIHILPLFLKQMRNRDPH
ncbi:MAG: hypothetical protein ACFCU9_01585 [Cyanophyceae cyanobacterium]|jgi:hypothetical protein